MSNRNSNNYNFNQEQCNGYQQHQIYSNNSHDNYMNSFGSTYNMPFNPNNPNFLRLNAGDTGNLTSLPSNQASSGSSNNEVSKCIDIRYSTLTPTAAEFKPRNQNYVTVGSDVNNGAVKKTQQELRNKRSSNTRFSQRYDRPNNSQDQLEPVDLKESKGIKDSKLQPTNRQDERGYAIKDITDRKPIENRKGPKENNKYYNNSNYANYNTNVDPKKKWNRNLHKYNRKYEDQPVKGFVNRENWRYSSSNTSDTDREKKTKIKLQLDLRSGTASQRERLQEMLERLQLECMVCCEKFRHVDLVWSCKQCYNILHLNCVKKWANTSKIENGWRCPACQNIYSVIPKEYLCYCDKAVNPRYDPGILPHSCGEICGRKGKNCDHTCVLLCHPGPCPDCAVPVLRACGCGTTKATVICGTDVAVKCQNTCNKLLNCGIHTCPSTCHPGECHKCEEFIKQECYCGKLGRKVSCTSEIQGSKYFECDDVCDKILACGNHKCSLICHSGSCAPCPTSVDVVSTCPCGQTKLTIERKSCLDPIPCCEKICNKVFNCGQPSDPHRCQSKCHYDACPPCPLTTVVKCRCGYMDRDIACKDLTTKADDARCEKKCTKFRHCGKHRCNQLCCIEMDHICPLQCNRSLSCGLHRCEESCHRARCPPCWRSSFQELYCECGSSVIYPPVPCGTKPPACNAPCSRLRSCGHEAFHNCHPGSCPPCTVLCKRWCHGKHEQRTTILCHQDDFSCGLPCGKDMPCRQHKCIQICHSDDCLTPCTQPCPKIRPNCEHACNQPCHLGKCPDVPCKQSVRVTCQCGLRSSTRTCMDLTGEYQSFTMTQLASKIAEIQKGQAVDITDIMTNQRKCGAPKTLECTEECRVAERNRRLAIGLQIRNPDLSAKLTPRFSDFMRGWAKKDPRFCQHIHDKLTELVQKAKQSKQKSRAHSFETMNREKRLFVHEYCQLFGCESEAYDAEPNRNVVATAYRDKSWLPSIGLCELIQRENGQRKVPGPVLESKTTLSKRELVPLRSCNKSNRPSTPPGEYTDYFDDPPI